MLQTCALLIALATAAPGAAPDAAAARRPAEPLLAFQCRAQHQPRARACAARCDAAFAPAAAADARFDCVTACTRRAVHATADCRAGLAALPAAPLASR